MTASAFLPVLQRPCVTLVQQPPHTSSSSFVSSSMDGSPARAPIANSASHPLSHSGSIEDSSVTGDLPQGSARQSRESDADGPGSGLPHSRRSLSDQSFCPRRIFAPAVTEPAHTSSGDPRCASDSRDSHLPQHVLPGLADPSSIRIFSGPRGSEDPSLATAAHACTENSPAPDPCSAVHMPASQEAESCSTPASAGCLTPPISVEGPSPGDMADVDTDSSGFRVAAAATSGAIRACSDADSGCAAIKVAPWGSSSEATECSGISGAPGNSKSLDSRECSQEGGTGGRTGDGPTGKGAGANRVYARDHGKKDAASSQAGGTAPATSASPPGGSAPVSGREPSGGAELLRCDLMWIASGNRGGLITPVEGCELHPIVIIRDRQGRVFDDDEESEENPIGKSSQIFFRWMRGPPRAVCTFHPQRTACLQCVVTLRCFCCYDCFRKGYKQLHKFYRTRGLSSILPHPNSHTYGVPCLPFDWNDFDSNRQFDTQHLALLKQAGLVTADGEEESWQPVSTSRNYTPSKADVGHQLRLETLVVDRETLVQLIESSRSQSTRRKSRERREFAGAADKDEGKDGVTVAKDQAGFDSTERQRGAPSSFPDGDQPTQGRNHSPDADGTDGASQHESARRPSTGSVSGDGPPSRRAWTEEKSVAACDQPTSLLKNTEASTAESSAGREATTSNASARTNSSGAAASVNGGASQDANRFPPQEACCIVLGDQESVDMAEAAAVAWAAASLQDSSHYRQVLTGCCVPTVDTVARRRRRLASVPHIPPVHGVGPLQPHGLGHTAASDDPGVPHGLSDLSLHRQGLPGTHEVRGVPDGNMHVPPSGHLDAFAGAETRGRAANHLFSPIDDMGAAAYGPVNGGRGATLSDGSLPGSVAFASSGGADPSYSSSSSFGDASSFAYGLGRSASGLCTYGPGGAGSGAATVISSYEATAKMSGPGFYQNETGISSGGPLVSRDGAATLGGESDGPQHFAHSGSGEFDDSHSDCGLSSNGSYGSSPAESPRASGTRSSSRCEKNSRHSGDSAGADLGPDDPEQFNVSVMTWNVLAELYGTLDAFPHCDPYMLAWPYRRQRILEEILAHNPDVVCLQEVQSEHFEDFFLPELARYGYNGTYKQKTMEVFTSGSGKKSGGKFTMDGCATFYRKSKFTIVDQCGLEFSQLIKQASREQLPRQLQRQAVRRLLKDNVALLLLLEVKNEGDARAAAAAEEAERGRNTETRRCDVNRSSSDSRALSASATTRSRHASTETSSPNSTDPVSRGREQQATGAGVASGGGGTLGSNRAESENPRGSRASGLDKDAEPVRSKLRANAPAWGETSRLFFDTLASTHGRAGGAPWGYAAGYTSADGNPSAHRKLLLVANTHIVANPESNDVKIWQAQTLVGMIEKYLLAFRPPAYRDSSCLTPAVVLCGDFNSTPDSAVYQLLVTGRCDRHHIDLASDRHGLLAELNLGHSIPLKSGYAVSKALKDGLDPHDFYALRQSEPEFTNYTGNYTGCLDYLFFCDTMLRVREILEPIDSKQLLREARQLQLLHQALPSPLRPSDHIPLLCKFEWIQ
uniref:Endonuclease/exonuclease/phosphatase family protein n=1 Tax=Toxoplasma gondii COUG TaxID=1074873 RepID=A0A2G8YDX5_TOXGO|nr:endonuclease/exonuclease/phosphatase family protein [Toxoplasma gondii COUG]